MSIRIHHIALLSVAALLLAAPHLAFAQQATASQLDDPGYLPGLWPSVISGINTTLNTALSNQTYSLWTKGIFAGLLITGAMWKLFQYQMGSMTLGDLIAYGVQILLFAVFLTSYSTWTYWIYEAGYELATMIQQATLGNDLLLGPTMYIAKVFASYTVDNSGTLFNFTIGRAVLGLCYICVGCLLDIAAYVSVMWPTLIYMLAKLIGPIFFIGLAFERTTFLFEGWFKLLLYASVYVLISRVVLIITALLVAGLSGITFSTTATPTLTVIPSTDFGAYLTILGMMALSLLFIFGAGGFTAFVVGTADIGLAKAVQGAARMIARVAGGGKK